ncbi:MAG: prolipoprotein diacylglyceryl transferase [Myxococcales bacterium]|nr:prolipoprotein diacylglyceryl transferase [Myxococcales bacterium]
MTAPGAANAEGRAATTPGWPALALSDCARPRVGARSRSAYTVLGFAGYGVANVLGVWLALAWQLSLVERLIGFLVPPLAFVVTVAVAIVIKGREWLVFYQVLFAALAAVAGAAVATGSALGRLLDLTTLAIGAFLVLGRLGCFHVACCHGRPLRAASGRRWRLGVAYGPAHVAAGFWPRWQGRPLVPVQLVESAASALWVGGALAGSAVPGRAAAIYATGYAVSRFGLELWRGDPVRPYWRGLSEAQWASLLLLVAVALAWPAWWTLVALLASGALALALVRAAPRRSFTLPPHLRELDDLARQLLAEPAPGRRDSQLGVGLSVDLLPDGRRDWILSSHHPAWSLGIAQQLAAALWPQAQVRPGRTPSLVHVIESVRSDVNNGVRPP